MATPIEVVWWRRPKLLVPLAVVVAIAASAALFDNAASAGSTGRAELASSATTAVAPVESSTSVPPTAADAPAPDPSVSEATTGRPATTADSQVPTATTPQVPAVADLPTRVLERISFDWRRRLPGWQIVFRPNRVGYRGSTFPDERRIEIYLRDDLTLEDLVHVTAHELGHAVDVELLDDADRLRWNEARGRGPTKQWWVSSGADDFSSGAGDWAESFAWSQQSFGTWYSRIAAPPDDEQLMLLNHLVG